MRRPAALTLALGLLTTTFALPATAQTRGHDQRAETLPLTRVRFYEVGVGYFERTGALRDRTEMSLPVPTAHLDDALKTLVVLSSGGEARVDGITFQSNVSRAMGVAMAGLPPENGGEIAYLGLLETLKGVSVSLKVRGTQHTGRLVDVEPAPPGGHQICTTDEAKPSCTVSHHANVLLLGDDGEIRRFRDDDITAVKPTDPAWRSRVDAALDALAPRGAQVMRNLNLEGEAGKPVSLGYVAETPVWRSSYRLVLPDSGDHGAVQGWALVHNDTDEDWRNIKVELSSGKPTSFLMPLAAPVYARRELREPNGELSTVPQLVDGMGTLWGDTIGESFGAGGLGLSGVGEGGGGYGEGIGLGHIGTIGHGSGTASGVSNLLGTGNLASLAPADGVEVGTQYRYALGLPIDLDAHHSALLPFMQADLKVRRVAYFESPGATPAASVHVTNDTQQTMPEGTVALFEGGGFAGETSIERTKPGDSRILDFGVDMDVELNVLEQDYEDAPKIVELTYGTLAVHYLRQHTARYELKNRSGSARSLYLPLHYQRNADVQGADELTYDSERGVPLAVFQVEPRKQSERTIVAREGRVEHMDVSDLTVAAAHDLARATTLSPDVRGTMRTFIAYHAKADKARNRVSRAKRVLAELRTDIHELRASAKALGEEAGDIRDELIEAEERAKELRTRIRGYARDEEKLRAKAVRSLDRLK